MTRVGSCVTGHCIAIVQILVPFVASAKWQMALPPSLQPELMQTFMRHEIHFPLACYICFLCTCLNPSFTENDNHLAKVYCNENAAGIFGVTHDLFLVYLYFTPSIKFK